MSITSSDVQRTSNGPRSVGQTMLWVMSALLPGTLLQAWLIGEELIQLLLTGITAALLLEALALRLRGRTIINRLSDGSIVVAAWLLVLCLPPSLPSWQLLIGVFVMVMLGKHLYGGLGHNPFNPAMVAYAVLLISFPATMTDWPNSLLLAEHGDATAWDIMTGATPLDTLRELRLPPRGQSPADYPMIASTLILQADWFKVNLAFLFGGLVLLWQGVIAWHIPLAVLAGFSCASGLLLLADYPFVLPLLPALLSGAVMLGVFFIATDPVTAAASRPGRLIYGFGIGILCVTIRQFSSYPEGVAFAVLLMNLTVPLIDHLLSGPGTAPSRRL